METQAERRDLTSNINRAVRQVEAESSHWKQLSVGILGCFAAVLFSYSFYQFLTSSTGASIWFVFLSLSLWTLIFLLQTALLEGRRVMVWFTLGQTALLAAIFILTSNVAATVIGAVLAAIMMMGAVAGGYRERTERLKIRFFRIGKVTLSRFSTGMAVFAAAAYIAVAMTSSVTLVSKEIFKQTFFAGSDWIGRVVPGISLKNTIRQNAEVLVRRQIAQNPGMAALSAAEQQSLVERSGREYEKYLSDLFKLPVDVRADTADALSSLLSLKVEQLVKTYGVIVYFIAAAIFVLILKGLAPIFYWPMIFIGWLIYQLMLAFGFAHLAYENQAKEVIIMK